MAQDSPNFMAWSSSSDANLCDSFDDCMSMRDCAGSMDLNQSAWLHLEQVSALHHPARIPFQHQEVLGPVDSQYDCGQVLKFQSAYNELSSDFLNKTPEASPFDSSAITSNKIPSRTTSFVDEIEPELDHQKVEAPVVKIKTGRRRRMADGTPDGWVASKNLISERKRREKLQKGLITLRELVPMFTMKMDKVSILIDTINYLQELKQKVELLETEHVNVYDDLRTDQKAAEVAKSSRNYLGTSDAENEGDHQKNSSTDGSYCSEVSDELVRCDYETSPSSQNYPHQIQLDVSKMDHGLFKLDIICMQKSGVVQLSKAIESFVIEVVHTSITVISSTKVTCTFIVKMSSWNDMTMEDIKVDVKHLLGYSRLHFTESDVKSEVSMPINEKQMYGSN